jgi:hypothetical protein
MSDERAEAVAVNDALIDGSDTPELKFPATALRSTSTTSAASRPTAASARALAVIAMPSARPR